MVLTLKNIGYEVSEAADGPSGLAVLEAEPEVDLLFTDVMMPGGMLGPELARRARDLQAELRVLFTTGHAAMVTAEDIRTMGAVLEKPWRSPELAQAVENALDDDQ